MWLRVYHLFRVDDSKIKLFSLFVVHTYTQHTLSYVEAGWGSIYTFSFTQPTFGNKKPERYCLFIGDFVLENEKEGRLSNKLPITNQ